MKIMQATDSQITRTDWFKSGLGKAALKSAFGASVSRRPAEALPKVLVGAAFVAASVFGSASQANAATQTFKKKILLPSNGEVFDLTIETEDGHHEKSALPRPLANADAGLDMSLNRYFQGKPVFFVVPGCR